MLSGFGYPPDAALIAHGLNIAKAKKEAEAKGIPFKIPPAPEALQRAMGVDVSGKAFATYQREQATIKAREARIAAAKVPPPVAAETKRPMWQWLAMLGAGGGLLYLLFRKKGGQT